MIAWAIAAIENESDRAFVEQLYENNYLLLYQKALGILKSPQRAEDTVEAVMLKLIDRIELLRGCNRASLRSYLVTCVKNEAISQLRKEKKLYTFGDVDDKLNALPDVKQTVDLGLLRESEVQMLMLALVRLPERERMALRMKYYEQMSDQEIGAVLGLTPSGVRTLISRAREKLRRILKEAEAE